MKYYLKKTGDDNMFSSYEQRSLQRKNWLNLFKEEELWAFYLRSKDLLVSTKGNVKRFSNNKVRKVHPDRAGYLQIKVKTLSDTTITKRVHRLVAETFLFCENKEYYEVNHIDGNKLNNSIQNLEWVTRKENLKHSFDNKVYRPLKGSENPRSKLSNTDVRNIRKLRKNNTLLTLAKKYKVTTTTIYLVCKNKTYKEVI